MSCYQKIGNKLICTDEGERLVIEPWGANGLRVRAVMTGDVSDADYALLPPPKGGARPVIECLERTASIANGKIKAVLETDGWNGRGVISFYNRGGALLLKEIAAGGPLKLRARDLQPISGGAYRLAQSFDAADEKLYGMGQYQQEILNLKGCSLELAQRNTQATVPFLLSSRGYGFLWHNPAIGKAVFGTNKTEWVAEDTRQLDYWITAGDTPAEIIQAYADATGKPPMMPEYGLGFWQCKLRYWSQKQVLDVAREYKKRGLPLDVIVVDFFHWPYMGDFRFEDEFFPDPKAMTDELNAMGVKLMVSVWPQVDTRSENYKEARRNNLLVLPQKGLNISFTFQNDGRYDCTYLDLTNPGAQDFIWQKCKKNYFDKGVGLFWLDEAEPEYSANDFDNHRYHTGSGAQIGNIYPQQFSKAFYDGMRAEGVDSPVNLVRCAWAGSQRYGALVWSGDIFSTYADLRRQVCAGLNMAVSGIPWWTVDIGGFYHGNPDDEKFRKLLVRWFQYGTFLPVMRLHGNRTQRREDDYWVYRADGSQSLFTGNDNEVWSYGEEAYQIFAKYMKLRETLRPITRRLMKEAHEKGSPVIRPMFYEFPSDAACWELKDQFMFGGDILVAPVLYENAYERNVYLPKGAKWTNAHDGKIYNGGQTVTVDAPLDVIPVFLRGGAALELAGKI